MFKPKMFIDIDDFFDLKIQERTSGDSKTYNEIIKHETLRVAVCEMLENENSCPKQLR
jgi:hypothetical protein